MFVNSQLAGLLGSQKSVPARPAARPRRRFHALTIRTTGNSRELK